MQQPAPSPRSETQWRGGFEPGDRLKTTDEFMEMYGAGEDVKLTSMFGLAAPDEGKKVPNGNGVVHNGDMEVEAGRLGAPLATSEPREPQDTSNAQDASDEDDEDAPDQRTGKRKLNKGLKLLSVIVKDIVEGRGSATYKEVADIILRDNIKFEGLHLNSKIEVAREEQNVKRRVYDALNVLISAGILVKEGKYVRGNAHADSMIVSQKRLHSNTLRSKIAS